MNTIIPPAQPYVKEIEQDPGRLRVAFNTQSPIGTPVHRDCIAAVKHTAGLLEKLGHDVEEARPDLDGLLLAKSFFTMYFGEVAADIMELEGPRFSERETCFRYL